MLFYLLNLTSAWNYCIYFRLRAHLCLLFSSDLIILARVAAATNYAYVYQVWCGSLEFFSFKLAFHDADTDTDTDILADSPDTLTSLRGYSRRCRCRRRGLPALQRTQTHTDTHTPLITLLTHRLRPQSWVWPMRGMYTASAADDHLCLTSHTCRLCACCDATGSVLCRSPVQSDSSHCRTVWIQRAAARKSRTADAWVVPQDR